MSRLLTWWRQRRERARAAVMLRAESEAMLDSAQQAQAQSDAMFAAADRAENLSARQFRLTFLGYALDCDARALQWQAGGDDEAAAEYRLAAAEWRLKAALFAKEASDVPA